MCFSIVDWPPYYEDSVDYSLFHQIVVGENICLKITPQNVNNFKSVYFNFTQTSVNVMRGGKGKFQSEGLELLRFGYENWNWNTAIQRENAYSLEFFRMHFDNIEKIISFNRCSRRKIFF